MPKRLQQVSGEPWRQPFGGVELFEHCLQYCVEVFLDQRRDVFDYGFQEDDGCLLSSALIQLVQQGSQLNQQMRLDFRLLDAIDAGQKLQTLLLYMLLLVVQT